MSARYLIFSVPITTQTASALMQELLKCYASPHVTEIVIGFASLGGNVPEATMLHTLLAGSPKPVIMHAIGNIESAAVTVYLGGGKRLASPGCLFMLHPMGATFANGVTMTLPLLRQIQQKLEEDEARLQRIWVARTGMPSDQVAELFATDSMRDAEWGRHNGFVHATADFTVPPGADLVWFST